MSATFGIIFIATLTAITAIALIIQPTWPQRLWRKITKALRLP